MKPIRNKTVKYPLSVLSSCNCGQKACVSTNGCFNLRRSAVEQKLFEFKDYVFGVFASFHHFRTFIFLRCRHWLDALKFVIETHFDAYESCCCDPVYLGRGVGGVECDSGILEIKIFHKKKHRSGIHSIRRF